MLTNWGFLATALQFPACQAHGNDGAKGERAVPAFWETGEIAKLERHQFCGSDLEMRQEINGKGALWENQESPDEQKLWIWKLEQHVLPVIWLLNLKVSTFLVYSHFFSKIRKMSRNCLNLKETSFTSFRDESFWVQEEKSKLSKVMLEPCQLGITFKSSWPKLPLWAAQCEEGCIEQSLWSLHALNFQCPPTTIAR